MSLFEECDLTVPHDLTVKYDRTEQSRAALCEICHNLTVSRQLQKND